MKKKKLNNQKVETKKEEPTEESKEPEELDGINTAGAEKRIRQLIKQRKEREEQLEAQQQQIADLQSQLQNSTKKVQETEAASLINFENQQKERLKLAEQSYKDAYDAGDKESLLKSTKKQLLKQQLS